MTLLQYQLSFKIYSFASASAPAKLLLVHKLKQFVSDSQMTKNNCYVVSVLVAELTSCIRTDNIMFETI